jgi:5-carboxymethyl-2-hydroxymuconate isomerase
MPHITVEYSANLEPEVAIQELLVGLHHEALDTGVFPIGGLRTRAERRDLYVIADGDPEHGFIAVLVRIGEGREAETRKDVAARLMAVLERQTAEARQRRGLALSVEVQEIDGTASLKVNNLHERMQARAEVA